MLIPPHLRHAIPARTERRYIVTRRWGVVELEKGADGLWRGVAGSVFEATIFAYSEGGQLDPVQRCGVGFFSLPKDNPLTRMCAVHDYQYSTPAWQAFHTRSESDAHLRALIEHEPSVWRIAARPFYYLARVFGGALWENKKTR